MRLKGKTDEMSRSKQQYAAVSINWMTEGCSHTSLHDEMKLLLFIGAATVVLNGVLESKTVILKVQSIMFLYEAWF